MKKNISAVLFVILIGLLAGIAFEGYQLHQVQQQRSQLMAQSPLNKQAPIILYATTWCPYCNKARTYFTQQGIAYIEKDIEKSAVANQEYHQLGGGGIPLIVFNGKIMRGFDAVKFERFYQAHLKTKVSS